MSRIDVIAPPPLALYVHLPWCVSKCPYCDFNSHRAGDHPPRDRYVEALLLDLGHEAERAAGRELTSIFIGGGTPSLFTGAEIGRLLEAVTRGFATAEDLEVTMEANPGTIERGSFHDYRAAGVNRVSLGAQSFDDRALGALGRIHVSDDTRRAVREARAAGFIDINLDLMFALPDQNLAGALADVRSAVELRPSHISHYQLTLEPNTAFYHSPPTLPDVDMAWEMQELCQEALADAGYRRYEVSAFALAGQECRHNLNYWQFGDYLAAGAGAHGKLTDESGGVWRYQKPASPRAYMERMTVTMPDTSLQPVRDGDLAFEYLLNALRLVSGFSMAQFTARTGLDPAIIESNLEAACRRGLLRRVGATKLKPTDLGLRFLNDLQALFLPARRAAGH